MQQAVQSNLLLYADDSCIFYQDKNVKVIEEKLTKDFSSLCDQFVDKKLSIHFGDDKTKSISFGNKHKIKSAEKLNVKYHNIEIKQHSNVCYLGCIFNESLSGDPMGLNVINKINARLRFLYRNTKILSSSSRRMLLNSLVQPHFDYASLSWFPNLTEKVRRKSIQRKISAFGFVYNQIMIHTLDSMN